MMKDPEMQKAIRGNSNDEELEELLKDLDITDDDTAETLAKKSNAKMKKLVKYFTAQVANAKDDAVEEATKDTREKEGAKIRKFSADNLGMKNDEVVELMQQRYDKGNSLEESYAFACKALDIDPKTGEAPKEETDEEKEAREKKEAKKKVAKKAGAKSSAKSGVTDADDDVDDDDDDESAKPMSLDEALASASAEFQAKNGNIFEDKKD